MFRKYFWSKNDLSLPMLSAFSDKRQNLVYSYLARFVNVNQIE